MKQIIGTSSNLFNFYNRQTKQFEPQAEVILITAEPGYKYDHRHNLDKITHASTIRFAADPKQLRAIAKDLDELADELEEINEPKEKDEPAKE
jgi:hypothetical protein